MKTIFYKLALLIFLLNTIPDMSNAQHLQFSSGISAVPNPFNTVTNVCYNLYQANPVRFSVLNMNGEEVFAEDKGNLSAGQYSFEWKGETSAGVKLPGGIYFLRMQTPSATETEKVILKNE